MPNVDWYIEGKEFGNCNCSYGCPCQFEAAPTHGHCRGFEAVQIERGHFGDVKLNGLRCVMFYAWPGPVFEGNGEMQIVIDERADQAQRAALESVLKGEQTEEAKTHWWVYRAMCTTVHPTLFKPIEFEADIAGRTAHVAIPDVLESSGRPITPPHSDEEHRVQIVMPEGGLEFDVAEIGSASTKATAAIQLDLENSYGQWNVLRHSGTGIVQ